MKRNYFLIVFLVLAIACKTDDNNAATDTSSDTTAIDPDAEINTGNRGAGTAELTISDDQYFNDPFNSKFTTQQLQKNHNDFSITQKEPVENRHIPGQMDTIITARANNSTFTIYKAKQDQLLQKAEIMGSNIELRNGVKVGMTTDEFINVFNQIKEPLAPDATVHLENSIVPSTFTFRFQNGRLNTIRYDGYVD